MTSVPHNPISDKGQTKTGRTVPEQAASGSAEYLGQWLADFVDGWRQDFGTALREAREEAQPAAMLRQILLTRVSDLEAAAQATGELIRRTSHGPEDLQ